MTILSYDLKILAADSLVTAGNTKVYNKSKIRIIKQHAIVSTGTENDGFRFEKWFFEQNGEEFLCEDSFGAIVLSRTKAVAGSCDAEVNFKLKSLMPVVSRMTAGCSEACSASDILMKVSKMNAHNATVEAANYHILCGEPVHSITKKQLEWIHPDFNGYWIGTYKTPESKIEANLITEKQWHKS
jgi:hypothetical protein